MGDGTNESVSYEDRLAALESRVGAADLGGDGRTVLARLLRYLPVLALGNLFVAAPAMIISVAVAYFAFEQAEATKKMQIGSVWPNVSYDSGNLDEAGEPQINFNISNRGVGPARIAGMQVSLDGKPYRSIQDLLRDCCTEKGDRVAVVMSSVNGEVIAPGDEFAFVQIAPEGVPARLYERIENTRMRVRAEVCFCSVFDDCWVEDSQSTAVRAVAQCPVDWVQYGFPSDVKPGG